MTGIRSPFERTMAPVEGWSVPNASTDTGALLSVFVGGTACARDESIVVSNVCTGPLRGFGVVVLNPIGVAASAGAEIKLIVPSSVLRVIVAIGIVASIGDANRLIPF